MRNKFLVGSDPEVFLSIGDRFISAHGLFPGDKDDPYEVEKGAIQVDGNALEFNIDAASSPEEFSNNIETVLLQMDEMIHKVDKDMKLHFIPYVEFDPEYFKSLPDEAKILGCNPDRNVFGLTNGSPSIGDMPFRTAAGHIHVGWRAPDDPGLPDHQEECLNVACNFFARDFGPFGPKTALEHKRLEFYGGNGAYRPKPYGVELRYPSNMWVLQKETREQMFNYVQTVMHEITG